MELTTSFVVELLEQFRTGEITLSTVWEEVEKRCDISPQTGVSTNTRPNTDKQVGARSCSYSSY